MASTTVARPAKDEICNNALLYMGHPRVSLSTSDPVAVAVSAAYDQTVFWALSMYPWKFALTQADLPEVTPDFEVEGYDNAYRIPIDCVVLHTVVGRQPYKVYQQYIFTNETAPITVEYVANVGASLFPPYFSDALTRELAARLTIPLTEDTSRAQLFKGEAQRAWIIARNKDSQIQTVDGFESAIYDTIRQTPTTRF